MRMRKLPYIFLIASCLVCMLSFFLLNNMSDRVENKNMNNLKDPFSAKDELSREKIVQIKEVNKKKLLNTNAVDRLKNNTNNNTSQKIVQTSQESIKKKNQQPYKIKYHKGRILVKFLLQEAEQIRQDKNLNQYGKIGRMVSRGGFYEVIPSEGESVEELLDKYNTDFSHMVQYAQLDYECEIQGRDKPDIKELKKDIEGLKNKKPKPIEELMWYLDAINITEAWKKTKGEKSVVIAILDTGIAFENFIVPDYEAETVDSEYYFESPYLQKAKIWKNKAEKKENKIDDDKNGYVDDKYGYDFVNTDVHPNDNNGHGTHLANIIGHNFRIRERRFNAGITNFMHQTNPVNIKGKGISPDIADFSYSTQFENLIYDTSKMDKRIRTGIAPGCTIMTLKVLNYKGKGFSSNIAEAIYYAVDNGADVINLSFAWPPNLNPGPIIHDAITYAANAGVIMVSGTGNNSGSPICYPAAYEEVIAVGSIQYDHKRAYYSNYGYEIEIVAPGGNIWKDQNLDGFPDGIIMHTFDPRYRFSLDGVTLANPSRFRFDFIHGTSVATAQVTGIVALLLSIRPELSLANIRSIISSTALDLGPSGWDHEYGYGLINAGASVIKAINGDYDEFPGDNGGNDDNNDGTNDIDGDGYSSIFEGGNDCDDYDAAIYPGANEIPYDGIDQDCDGTDLADVDNDGYYAIDVGGTDCDDHDPAIHPGALEIEEDGIDQDCDGGDNTSTGGAGWIENTDSCDNMGWEGDCESCSSDDEIELECL